MQVAKISKTVMCKLCETYIDSYTRGVCSDGKIVNFLTRNVCRQERLRCKYVLFRFTSMTIGRNNVCVHDSKPVLRFESPRTLLFCTSKQHGIVYGNRKPATITKNKKQNSFLLVFLFNDLPAQHRTRG